MLDTIYARRAVIRMLGLGVGGESLRRVTRIADGGWGSHPVLGWLPMCRSKGA